MTRDGERVVCRRIPQAQRVERVGLPVQDARAVDKDLPVSREVTMLHDDLVRLAIQDHAPTHGTHAALPDPRDEYFTQPK
jgi:hypothetical protein